VGSKARWNTRRTKHWLVTSCALRLDGTVREALSMKTRISFCLDDNRTQAKKAWERLRAIANTIRATEYQAKSRRQLLLWNSSLVPVTKIYSTEVIHNKTTSFEVYCTFYAESLRAMWRQRKMESACVDLRGETRPARVNDPMGKFSLKRTHSAYPNYEERCRSCWAPCSGSKGGYANGRHCSQPWNEHNSSACGVAVMPATSQYRQVTGFFRNVGALLAVGFKLPIRDRTRSERSNIYTSFQKVLNIVLLYPGNVVESRIESSVTFTLHSIMRSANCPRGRNGIDYVPHCM
jgi:hypothetical protein